MTVAHRRTSSLPWLLCALLASCGDDTPPPGGFGWLGAACYTPRDCASGFCCTSPPCGGGTCSYPCRRDLDCPPGAACEGGVCFVACRTDADCPYAQRCRHEHTVCQH